MHTDFPSSQPAKAPGIDPYRLAFGAGIAMLVALLVWPARSLSSSSILFAMAGTVVAGGLGYRYARTVLIVLVAGCPIFALAALMACATLRFTG